MLIFWSGISTVPCGTLPKEADLVLTLENNMYLYPNPAYYRGTQQIALRAPFLLLIQQDGRLYAVVRRVALRQIGHWMMGSANLNGKWLTISGAYGNDGLPMDVDHLPKDAIPLPPDVAEAYWKGGGWNSAGSEAPLLREWAIDRLPKILANREGLYTNDRRAA